MKNRFSNFGNFFSRRGLFYFGIPIVTVTLMTFVFLNYRKGQRYTSDQMQALQNTEQNEAQKYKIPNPANLYVEKIIKSQEIVNERIAKICECEKVYSQKQEPRCQDPGVDQQQKKIARMSIPALHDHYEKLKNDDSQTQNDLGKCISRKKIIDEIEKTFAEMQSLRDEARDQNCKDITKKGLEKVVKHLPVPDVIRSLASIESEAQLEERLSFAKMGLARAEKHVKKVQEMCEARIRKPANTVSSVGAAQ